VLESLITVIICHYSNYIVLGTEKDR